MNLKIVELSNRLVSGKIIFTVVSSAIHFLLLSCAAAFYWQNIIYKESAYNRGHVNLSFSPWKERQKHTDGPCRKDIYSICNSDKVDGNK